MCTNPSDDSLHLYQRTGFSYPWVESPISPQQKYGINSFIEFHAGIIQLIYWDTTNSPVSLIYDNPSTTAFTSTLSSSQPSSDTPQIHTTSGFVLIPFITSLIIITLRRRKNPLTKDLMQKPQ
ncbi:MAG: hypothetical protein ACTSPV_15225 [Candidatus Hodarchaeales archaeon]